MSQESDSFEQDSFHEDARGEDAREPVSEVVDSGSPPQDEESRESPPVPQRRIPKAAVVLAIVVLLALALSLFWSWWRQDPQTPLSRLGLETGQELDAGSTPAGEGGPNAELNPAGAGAVDPEQEAFLERQRRRAQELADSNEALEPAESITFTDRDLIRSLAGRWRLDLGGRWVVAEFAPVVVERVRRGSLLVELYPVQSRGLPPYYTVFELPDQGAYIAFRGADGSYRLVLERVIFHDLDVFSFQLGRGGERRNAYRLGGSRLPPSSTEATTPRGADGGADGADRGSPPPQITVEPPPPADELWRQAEALRDAGRLHSLKGHLRRVLIAYPDHRQARRWERRIDRWIADQREDVIDDLQDALGELAEGVQDRDLDEIFDTWDGRPDAGTRRFFGDLVTRHRELDARITLLTVRVEDGVADFVASVTLEGWSGRARNREIVPLRWRGQLRDGHFVTPFG